MLGTKEPLIFSVLITNNGEDAFEAGFYMTIPEDLNYKKYTKLGDLPVTCTQITQQQNRTLKCDIGNPLPARSSTKLQVELEHAVNVKSGISPAHEFYMEVNSTNAEADKSAYDDNIFRKTVLIWVDSELHISG